MSRSLLVCLALAGSAFGCAGIGTQTPASEPALGPHWLPAGVHRLSNAEYERSVGKLVGAPVSLERQLPPDIRQSGYTRNAEQVVSAEGLARIDAVTRPIARDAVSLRLLALASCAQLPTPACVAASIGSLGTRAFRRPVTGAERVTLRAAFAAGEADGGGFAGGIEGLLRALFVAPSFIYTTELGAGGAPGDVVTLDPYEIASALSYTVQGAPPDSTLLNAAESGSLSSPDVREREARRLLAESDTRYQFRRFVLEWLEVDELEQTAKSTALFADYEQLKPHLLDETNAFVDEVMVHHGGSLSALLTAGFASVDPSMARFYGLRGYGPEASLAGSGRLGILQQASFLAAHAHEDASSPVKRGDFVLRRLLCENVKRPGEVGINIVFPAPTTTHTTRERFDVHVGSPECAGCHVRLDQFGFSFEEFDAVGRRRATENGRPIDTQASIWLDGQARQFASSRDISRYLAQAPQVSECFARQAFRYFSAATEPGAEGAFVALTRALPSRTSRSLIAQLLAFVTSDLFVKRQIRFDPEEISRP